MPTTFAWERKKVHVSRLRMGLAVGLFLIAALAAGTSYADASVQTVDMQTAEPGTGPLSTLVKFGEREYEISHEDWVSLEPISSTTVRKVGYGHVTSVNIATTPSGTYSSDGMVSPHVRYPGITVRAVETAAHGYYRGWQPLPGTHMFALGSTPRGERVFHAIRPNGSFACLGSGGSTVCSAY